MRKISNVGLNWAVTMFWSDFVALVNWWALATMDEKWLPVIHRKLKYDGTVPSIEPLRLEKCFTSSWFEQRNKTEVQGNHLHPSPSLVLI